MHTKGIDTMQETHFYALIIKLSLSSFKTWRESLENERKKNFLKVTAMRTYHDLIMRKHFCKWIEEYLKKAKSKVNFTVQESN